MLPFRLAHASLRYRLTRMYAWPPKLASTGKIPCCWTSSSPKKSAWFATAPSSSPRTSWPRVLEAFRHEQTDPKIFREMGETGLLGATIPEAYGGSGLNYVCYGLIAREVERVDPAIAR